MSQGNMTRAAAHDAIESARKNCACHEDEVEALQKLHEFWMGGRMFMADEDADALEEWMHELVDDQASTREDKTPRADDPTGLLDPIAKLNSSSIGTTGEDDDLRHIVSDLLGSPVAGIKDLPNVQPVNPQDEVWRMTLDAWRRGRRSGLVEGIIAGVLATCIAAGIIALITGGL